MTININSFTVEIDIGIDMLYYNTGGHIQAKCVTGYYSQALINSHPEIIFPPASTQYFPMKINLKATPYLDLACINMQAFMKAELLKLNKIKKNDNVCLTKQSQQIK